MSYGANFLKSTESAMWRVVARKVDFWQGPLCIILAIVGLVKHFQCINKG